MNLVKHTLSLSYFQLDTASKQQDECQKVDLLYDYM